MSIENFSDRAIFISEFLHYLLLYRSAELYIVAFSLSLLLIQCFIDLQSRLLPDIRPVAKVVDFGVAVLAMAVGLGQQGRNPASRLTSPAMIEVLV